MKKQRLESSRMDIKRNYWPLRRTWTFKRYWCSRTPFFFLPFVLSFHLAFFPARYPLAISLYPILSFISGLSCTSSFFSRDCTGYFPILPLHTRNLNYRCPSVCRNSQFYLRFQFSKDSMLETLFAYMSTNGNTIRNLIFRYNAKNS